MTLRRRRRNEHNQVALTVIYFLGCVASISALMSGFLIHEAVVSNNAIDAAVVALIGQQVSITTLALGALGAMLSSTAPRPPPPPMVNGATPVNVVNPPDDPVETHPQPAATDVAVDDLPDEPAADDPEVVAQPDAPDPWVGDKPARAPRKRPGTGT